MAKREKRNENPRDQRNSNKQCSYTVIILYYVYVRVNIYIHSTHGATWRELKLDMSQFNELKFYAQSLPTRRYISLRCASRTNIKCFLCYWASLQHKNSFVPISYHFCIVGCCQIAAPLLYVFCSLFRLFRFMNVYILNMRALDACLVCYNYSRRRKQTKNFSQEK